MNIVLSVDFGVASSSLTFHTTLLSRIYVFTDFQWSLYFDRFKLTNNINF